METKKRKTREELMKRGRGSHQHREQAVAPSSLLLL
jgi:hypothetical protein